jgi:hypothetical protein
MCGVIYDFTIWSFLAVVKPSKRMLSGVLVVIEELKAGMGGSGGYVRVRLGVEFVE